MINVAIYKKNVTINHAKKRVQHVRKKNVNAEKKKNHLAINVINYI
jgi:hypothetical protein